MTRGTDFVRDAVAGADRGFAVIDGGRGSKPPPLSGPPDATEKPCPVTAIGHIDGRYVFLNAVGEKRELLARQLGSKNDVLSLFGHQDDWLRDKFPKKAKVQTGFEEDGRTPILSEVVVDFALNLAAKYLGQACFQAGIFGDQIVLRRPGVWPHAADCPAVHCGDQVRIGTEWCDAGYRSGNTIWAAAPAVPRPGIPCDKSIAVALQDSLQQLFCFREPGGATAVMGLLGTAYFGAAARWRSAGFLLGPAGCGKSTLLEVMQAACPVHFFSNDTTKAGLEQGLDGRAMPCFLDENEKTGDQRGAQNLLDLVLTASGGAGTRGVRGGADGRSRRIEVVGSVVMAATAPPEMRETHTGRFAMIELVRPEEGADFRDAHAKLIATMKGHGPALWSRALSAWERYQASIVVFREGLKLAGCAPREMDQLGAILAGWWILTHEAVPDSRGAREGILALNGLVRTTDVVAEEGNARRLVRYLLSFTVQLDRTTDRESIATLIGICLNASKSDQEVERHVGVDLCRRVLLRHGIRVIRADEPDYRKTPAPRMADGAGIWFGQSHTELARIFEGSDWAGSRWQVGLRDLPSAKKSVGTIKFGEAPSRGIWISAFDLEMEDKPPDAWDSG